MVPPLAVVLRLVLELGDSMGTVWVCTLHSAAAVELNRFGSVQKIRENPQTKKVREGVPRWRSLVRNLECKLTLWYMSQSRSSIYSTVGFWTTFPHWLGSTWVNFFSAFRFLESDRISEEQLGVASWRCKLMQWSPCFLTSTLLGFLRGSLALSARTELRQNRLTATSSTWIAKKDGVQTPLSTYIKDSPDNATFWCLTLL